MITYEGVKTIDKKFFLCFANDKGETIEVPVDQLFADRIIKYLSRISLPVVSNEENSELSD